MKNKGFQLINGFFLKVFGMIFMTFDHVGIMLQKYENLQQISNIFRCIGRLALPIFIFLIVEGIRHTSSIKKYFIRLGILEAVVLIPMVVIEYKFSDNLVALSSPITDLLLVALVCYLFERKDRFTFLAILPFSYMVLCFVVECVELGAHTPCLWLPFFARSPYSLFSLFLGFAFYFSKPISISLLKNNASTSGLEMTEYQRTAENAVSAISIVLISMAFYAFYWATGISYFVGLIIAFSALSAILIFLYSGKRGYNKPWFKYGSYVYFPLHLIIIYLVFALI